MTHPTAKAEQLAKQIEERARVALAELDLVMKSWPPEFRSIMWRAVELEAARRGRATNP